MRLVVVDDDPDIRMMLSNSLPLSGFEVVGEAGNGAEAIGVVERLQPDGVVLDQMMPFLTGLEVLRMIKRLTPQARVVIYSAGDINSFRAEALQLGAHRVLAKTGATASLVAALRSELPEAISDVA